ncbi:MAG: hypothetical protein PHI11_11390 [Gallionella sp.]|nr:hypothetical protein [Gallionella sp.]
MNTAIETRIIEQLHRLDASKQAEVLDFVEYLTAKFSQATVNWPMLDPAQDLAGFVGSVPVDEDAVAYTRT